MVTKFNLASLGIKKAEPQASSVNQPVDKPAAKPALVKGQSLLAALAAKSSTATATVPEAEAEAKTEPKAAKPDEDFTPVEQQIIESKPVIQVIEGPENFKEILDSFDTLIAHDSGLDVLNIGAARKYVETIMVTLRTHPEYDGILVSRDVHNVMEFIRSSKKMTEAAYVKAGERRAKREAKAKAKVAFDLSGLAGPPKADSSLNLATLDALASFDADSIAASMAKRKKK